MYRPVKMNFLYIEVRKSKSEYSTKTLRNGRELMVSNSQGNFKADTIG